MASAAWSCLGIVALGLGAVAVLAFVGPLLLGNRPSEVGPSAEPEPSGRPGPAPTPEPNEYLPYVGSRNGFGRSVQGNSWRLTYGFIDHHGHPVDIACNVDQRDHERERAWFGYSEAATKDELNRRLGALATAELERRGITPYVSIRFENWGGYQWKSEFAGTTTSDELARAVAARDAWDRWMESNIPRERDRIRGELLHDHGFLDREKTIDIDYATLAVRGSSPLRDCARALDEAAKDASDRRALGIFIAFLQELPYQLPPDRTADGREIQGLWVPTEVLVNDHGDCDSKAVAFCALWRHRAESSLIITVPGHALVGVEGRPGPGESFIRLGNRYYILCEVAGPGKSRPGSHPISGSFEYVTVPGG